MKQYQKALLNREFMRGMDISSLPEMLEHGKKYFDFDGREKDPLVLIKENGANYIRLRVWNEPENVKESGGYCDPAKTVAFARRIKEMGFSLFLDFHYSDWWADPGKQNKPRSWEDLPLPELAQALYDFTKTVLQALDDAGAYPDMVQIGNEIRNGMLFPDGAAQNWPGLALLLNHGIRAVRDTRAGRNTPVVLHLDQGGRYCYFRDWFDEALAHGVTDFDVIGLSYYPFWHGTFYELASTMDNLAGRYKRPLVIAETAHAWRIAEDGIFGREQERIAGFPATPAAQRKVLELVMEITANVRDGMGLGVFYWEPLMLPVERSGGWAASMGLTDTEGRALEGLKAFSFKPENASADG